jgi:hypothetical protein
MRAYFLGNFYLSSIQQGIQAAHALAEMTVRYHRRSKRHKQIVEWINRHKVMVILNGGCQKDIRESVKTLSRLDLPYAPFHEGKDDLNSALTCVGFVAPTWLCDMIDALRTDPELTGAQWDERSLADLVPRDIAKNGPMYVEFARHIARLPLAR